MLLGLAGRDHFEYQPVQLADLCRWCSAMLALAG